MNCLSNEQLVALILADQAPAGLAIERLHVNACADCAARLERVQEQLGRLEAATMSWFERDHAAERQRLLAALADKKPAIRPTVTQKLKEVLSMPRTWIGSAAAAVLVLALFFLWNGGGNTSLVAQTTSALRDVRSYQCRMTLTMSAPDGKKSEPMTGKAYWAAPGSIRMDMYKGDKLIEVNIMPKDKPGLEINHRYETFSRLEPARGAMSPLLLMGKLARYSGQADRKLDRRQINGTAAPGFEIDLAKIDPDLGDGNLRVWTDPKTKLPLRVEVTKESGAIVWDEFRWNLPSERWFTLEPPVTYQDKTPTPPDVEKITKDIITGLKTYAKYCGGKYPQVKMVYGDVTSEELNRNAGLPPRSPPRDTRSKVYVECLKAHAGFGQLNMLQRHSREAVYHGKTVGPQDKGKVLFRWKLNDGRFRVIFGDLRVQDVSEARLQKLEGK